MLNAKHYYRHYLHACAEASYWEGIASSLCLCACAGSADQTVRLWSSKLPETLAAEGTPLLKTLKTKATPVFHVHFMRTNLLMAAGALTLGR